MQFLDLSNTETKRLRKLFTELIGHAPNERTDEWKDFVRRHAQKKYQNRLLQTAT